MQEGQIILNSKMICCNDARRDYFADMPGPFLYVTFRLMVATNCNCFILKSDKGNVQISYDASGGGLLKPSECCHMEGGVWPKHHITFVVAEKV